MKEQIIEIDDAIIAQFESLPEAAHRKGFTAEEDKILLRYWPEKNKEAVAKLLGFSTTSCRKRYQELTENESK